mgnify:FL=1
MQRLSLFIVTTLLSLAAGCEQIDLPAEKNCRALHSELVSRVEAELIPALDDIESFDQYFDFVVRNYEYMEARDTAFRGCLRSSASTTTDQEMQRWIKTGVSLNGIQFFWANLLENPDQFGLSHLDSLIGRDRRLLMHIVEPDIP